MGLRSVFFDIGFDLDDGPVKEANKSVDKFKKNTRNSKNEMEKLEDKTGSFGNTAAAAFDRAKTKISNVGNTLQEYKEQLLGFSAAGAAFLGVSIRNAAAFNSKMVRAGALANANQQELGKMREAAMDAGINTAHTAESASKAMGILAQRGFEVNESISSLEPVLQGASANQVQLQKSASVTSTALNSMQLEAKETERVVDVLTKTASTSGANFASLEGAFQKAGAAASQVGWSIEQTAAAVGTLGDVSLKGGKAGTVLNAMIRDLNKSAENGRVSINGMAVDIADAQGNFLGMNKILQQVSTAVEGLGTQEKRQALSDVFKAESIKGLSVLLQRGVENLGNYQKTLESAGGTAESIAEKQLDTLSGSLQLLKGSLNVATITIGRQFVPVIKFVSDTVKAAVNAFNEWPKAAKSMIAITIGLATVFSGLAAAVGFANAAIGMLAANPIVITIAAWTTAIVALGAVIWDLWKGIAGGESFLVPIINKFLEWIGISSSFQYMIMSVWITVRDFFVDVWDLAKSFGSLLFSIFGDSMIQIFKGTFQLLASIVMSFFGFFKSLFTGNMDLTRKSGQMFINSLKNIFGGLIGFFTDINQWLRSKMSGLTDWLMKQDFMRPVINAFGADKVRAFAEKFMMIFKNLALFIANPIGTIAKLVGWLINWFKTTDVSAALMTFGKQFLNGMWKVAEWILTPVDFIIDKIMGLIDWLGNLNIGAALANMIRSGIDILPGWLKSPAKKILGFFSDSGEETTVGTAKVQEMANVTQGVTGGVAMARGIETNRQNDNKTVNRTVRNTRQQQETRIENKTEVGKIEVKEAENPRATARAVRDEINKVADEAAESTVGDKNGRR